MISVTIGDFRMYDSKTNDRPVLSVKATAGVNKAGTAEITITPGHPYYDSVTNYRSKVTITRRGEDVFYGRVLYQADDFYGRRTFTCEGALCFLRDAVMRPYSYSGVSSATVFREAIEAYNSQVEEGKRLQIGSWLVSKSVDMESETAEQVADTIDKLVELCGGYIEVKNLPDGLTIFWREDLGYRSNQVIEFGKNLLDFTRTQSNTDLATRVIPYGAKNEAGEYLTIESVNDGLDFIEDAAAVAHYGVITKPVYFEDITDPQLLLQKAQAYLDTSRRMVDTLELSAVDLSLLDVDIDTLRVGDMVRVVSKPHGLDYYFQLRERTYDLLDPAQDTVVLGQTLTTLVRAGVDVQRAASTQLHKVENVAKADYTLNMAKAIEETTQTLSALIQQTSEEIMLAVSETYATNDDVKSQISTTFTQLSESFNFEFETLRTTIDENDAAVRQEFETQHKYIRFIDGNILLGEDGNELTLRIEKDRISFLDGGAEVAYFSNKQLFVLDGHFLNSLRVGKFAFLPRENGNLSLVKVGN